MSVVGHACVTGARPAQPVPLESGEVQELIPIGLGLLLGGALGYLRPAWRVPVAAVLAVVLGALVTFFTGEAEISWTYLLIDIPLVAVGALLGVLAARRLVVQTR
jgi:hypothetical protein